MLQFSKIKWKLISHGRKFVRSRTTVKRTRTTMSTWTTNTFALFGCEWKLNGSDEYSHRVWDGQLKPTIIEHKQLFFSPVLRIFRIFFSPSLAATAFAYSLQCTENNLFSFPRSRAECNVLHNVFHSFSASSCISLASTRCLWLSIFIHLLFLSTTVCPFFI